MSEGYLSRRLAERLTKTEFTGTGWGGLEFLGVPGIRADRVVYLRCLYLMAAKPPSDAQFCYWRAMPL